MGKKYFSSPKEAKIGGKSTFVIVNLFFFRRVSGRNPIEKVATVNESNDAGYGGKTPAAGGQRGFRGKASNAAKILQLSNKITHFCLNFCLNTSFEVNIT